MATEGPTFVSEGASDIATERARQIHGEGYDPAQDPPWQQLAMAADAYLTHAEGDSQSARAIWPWDLDLYHPTDARRTLVKAGALVAAAIDAFDRDANDHDVQEPTDREIDYAQRIAVLEDALRPFADYARDWPEVDGDGDRIEDEDTVHGIDVAAWRRAVAILDGNGHG